MKKHLFLLIIITIFGFAKARAQSIFTKEQLFEILKKQAYVDTLVDEIRISKQIIPPNTKLYSMEDTITSPSYSTWFYFIDKCPEAKWTHPCKYVFANIINADLFVIEGNSPIDIETIYILSQQRPDSQLRNQEIKKSMPLKSLFQSSYFGNYAIIINGGYDKSFNNIASWYDCSYVYKTLLSYGYKKEDIYVLMADGTDSNEDTNITENNADKTQSYSNQNLDLDGDFVDDIRYSATKPEIIKVFDLVKEQINNGLPNSVFIYTTDHGGLRDATGNVYLWLWNKGTLMDFEFNILLKKLDLAAQIEIVMDQCHSGGFADKLTQPNAMIVTSCGKNEVAKGKDNIGSYFTADWLASLTDFNFVTQERQSGNCADFNEDGVVSFYESAAFAKYKSNYNSTSSIQYKTVDQAGNASVLNSNDPNAFNVTPLQNNTSSLPLPTIGLGNGFRLNGIETKSDKINYICPNTSLIWVKPPLGYDWALGRIWDYKDRWDKIWGIKTWKQNIQIYIYECNNDFTTETLVFQKNCEFGGTSWIGFRICLNKNYNFYNDTYGYTLSDIDNKVTSGPIKLNKNYRLKMTSQNEDNDNNSTFTEASTRFYFLDSSHNTILNSTSLDGAYRSQSSISVGSSTAKSGENFYCSATNKITITNSQIQKGSTATFVINPNVCFSLKSIHIDPDTVFIDTAKIDKSINLFATNNDSIKLSSNSKISISPNPTMNIINIGNLMESQNIGYIEIYNSTGILLQKKVVEKNIEQLQLQSYTNGIYILKIVREDGSFEYRKVLLKK